MTFERPRKRRNLGQSAGVAAAGWLQAWGVLEYMYKRGCIKET